MHTGMCHCCLCIQWCGQGRPHTSSTPSWARGSGEGRAAVVEEEGGIPVLVEMVEGGTSPQEEGAAGAGRARRAREMDGERATEQPFPDSVAIPNPTVIWNYKSFF